MRIMPWYYEETKGAIHFHPKVKRCVLIAKTKPICFNYKAKLKLHKNEEYAKKIKMTHCKRLHSKSQSN